MHITKDYGIQVGLKLSLQINFIRHILLFLLFDSIFFSHCESDNEVSSLQQLFLLIYVMYDNVRGDDGNLAENFTFSVSFNHLARAQTKNWTSLRYFFDNQFLSKTLWNDPKLKYPGFFMTFQFALFHFTLFLLKLNSFM